MKIKPWLYSLIGICISASTSAALLDRDELHFILKYYPPERIVLSNSKEFSLEESKLVFMPANQPQLNFVYYLETLPDHTPGHHHSHFYINHHPKINAADFEVKPTDCHKPAKFITSQHPVFGPIKICASGPDMTYPLIARDKQKGLQIIGQGEIKQVSGWASFMMPDRESGIRIFTDNSPPEVFARFLRSLSILRPKQAP